MPEPLSQRFVRVPTELLEALVRTHFSGGEYRILWWVIRQTYGWNRSRAPFTWYRIARELVMARPAVYRSGLGLMKAGIVVIRERQISIRPDYREWRANKPDLQSVAHRQLRLSESSVADKQRPTLPAGNAIVAAPQQKRCQGATLFRRAKDIKDSIKKYLKTGRHARADHSSSAPVNPEQRHLAKATPTGPGKYERISQH